MGQPRSEADGASRASGDPGSSQPPLGDSPPAALTEIHGNGDKVIRAGEHFGRLVAVRRSQLGLSQEELAAKMQTSPATIAGIEEGESPNSEVLERLTAALNVAAPGTGVLGLSSARAAASGNGARPRGEPLGGRWFWAGIAVAALIPLAIVLGGQLSGGDADDSPPDAPPPVAAVVPVVPAPVEAVKKDKSAKKEKEAAAKREESSSPSPSSDSGSDFTSEPSSPVTSSPAPSSSSGGGGGGSSGGGGGGGGSPQIQHGIGD